MSLARQRLLAPSASLGHYLTPVPGGFTLHMSASPQNLRAARHLVNVSLADAGADEELADAVQLVLSELCGNAVRACGDYVPLVAQVEVESVAGFGRGKPSAVWVRLHDPRRDTRPRLSGISLDDGIAESGRGMGIVELLAPGWGVKVTPIGKQINCRVVSPGL